MNNKPLYLDLHVLQNVPPSCVNRDDTGSPKTAVYGGVNRARVSSQSWKHSMREMFKNEFEPDKIGFRTKRIVEKVAEQISILDTSVDAEDLAVKALESAGLTIKSKEKGTDALFFLSLGQAINLAKLSVDYAKIDVPKDKDEKKTFEKEKKNAFKSALKDSPSVDMILFGRMVAKDPSLDYDAVSQVAHCVSTHAVNTEFDYFTAVDDCSVEDNAGAGHLGTVEFNSSTLYRYANINITELVKQSAELTPDIIEKFINCFVYSMPTGKQNTFANRTVPDMIYLAVREGQPVNLVGAFEKPVKSNEGYLLESEKRFVEYAKGTYEKFVSAPVMSYGVSMSEILGQIAELGSVEKAIATVTDYIAAAVK